MKLIYLNAVISVPNQDGEEKIQKASNKKGYDPRNDKTPPKSWFIEQNLTPPDDAEDDEVETDKEGNVFLEEHEMEAIPVPVTIPIENLGSWVASLDGGSRVYTKSNLAYDVIEEVWEIDTMVEYLLMSWFEKKYLFFQSFLGAIKNKITGKKVVDLQELLSRPENNPE